MANLSPRPPAPGHHISTVWGDSGSGPDITQKARSR
jgi:hypothetical protein